MEHLDHSSLLQPQDFACGDRRDCCKAPPVAVQAAFAKKVPLPMDCDHGFLALLRNHGDLAFTLPDVKNRVRRITLSEHDFILAISTSTFPHPRWRGRFQGRKLY